MAFKFFAFAAFIVAANAGVISSPYETYATAPVVAKYAAPALVKQVVQEEYNSHPQYQYGYDIQDAVTGDIKSQKEVRDGDVVQGSYSLIDADGLKRTVDYTADSVHGFNAVVRREPIHATKLVAPVGYAAPIAKYATGPVAYAPSPVQYAAPIAKYAASPLAYAPSPVHYAAPVAKYAAAPVSYAGPVSYGAPTYSAYHH